MPQVSNDVPRSKERTHDSVVPESGLRGSGVRGAKVSKMILAV